MRPPTTFASPVPDGWLVNRRRLTKSEKRGSSASGTPSLKLVWAPAVNQIDDLRISHEAQHPRCGLRRELGAAGTHRWSATAATIATGQMQCLRP